MDIAAACDNSPEDVCVDGTMSVMFNHIRRREVQDEPHGRQGEADPSDPHTHIFHISVTAAHCLSFSQGFLRPDHPIGCVKGP
ncbi:MAG: hypothetical protein J2P48_04360 [Alphaproteobacteria bacterium]|nr:hypothetical protein [Alphaproteobacteria bacterium]